VTFFCIDSETVTIYKIVTMTNWLPDLSQGSGPLYVRLADRIEADIAGGILPVGEKLPPQRNLAFDIGVTIGTVTRAYNLVRERGLVSGEVGRGTFVLNRDGALPASSSQPASPILLPSTQASTPTRIRLDSTSAPEVGQAEILRALTAEAMLRHVDKVNDYTRLWPQAWRDAGRRWLGAGGWAPDAANIVPTTGVHAAIMAIVAACTAPGDRIAFEALTYSSIARSINLLGRRSVSFRNDGEGPDAEDFERLCAQQHPKLVFLMPALHNPTLAAMTAERRAAIVAVARKHNVLIIEDTIYAALLDPQPQPLAALAPERTFLVGGLSKAVSAGVRGGWAACPPHYAQRVQIAHKMVTGGLPFLLAELSAQLVNTGNAEAIRVKVRAEVAAREAMARAAFQGLEFSSHPHIPFLWLKLPEPWLSSAFKQVAASEGVLVDDEDEYKSSRTERVHHRIRIGFSVPQTRGELEAGFATIRRLLENGVPYYDSYG